MKKEKLIDDFITKVSRLETLIVCEVNEKNPDNDDFEIDGYGITSEGYICDTYNNKYIPATQSYVGKGHGGYDFMDLNELFAFVNSLKKGLSEKRDDFLPGSFAQITTILDEIVKIKNNILNEQDYA